MRTSIKLLLVALPLLLAGCALTPEYQRPTMMIPSDWDNAVPGHAAAVDETWWQRFGSAELAELMAEAMVANQDLAVALARIEQARATARGASAGRLPDVSAGLSAGRSRSDGRTRESGQAELSIAYELDLWRANAAAAQAAQARLLASAYDLEAAQLVLQAELATTYFRALALKSRLAIARDNLAIARQLLELVQIRADLGAATELELAQQRTAVLSLEAELPSLQLQLEQAQHALAVLLGRPPQGFAIRGSGLAELRLPTVAPLQPASLLERRPDIRRAEAQLAAAHADIGVARAALHPSLRLSASGGVADLLTGGSASFASLIGALSQSIFDGSWRRSQVTLSEARRDELAAQYVRTVLTGFREVEDALAAVQASEARAAALSQAAAQAQLAYRLALVRYEAGTQDLLNLLDSQRSRLQAEDGLVQAELSRFLGTVDLFKALGGSWESPEHTT